MKIHTQYEWAFSSKGLPIPLYQSHENPLGGLLWIGGVHGDEPEGVELATKTLNWLKTHKVESPFQWSLIPCLNPDGVTLKQRVNGNNVDLNRNYPSQDWNGEHSKKRYYPGPTPGSEPEVQALTKLIKHTQPKLIVHCHSWKPCVVYSGEGGARAAQLLAECSGYKLQTHIGYDTPGSLSSYASKDKNIPVICIEEQDHIDLDLVWPHFEAAVKTIFTEGF